MSTESPFHGEPEFAVFEIRAGSTKGLEQDKRREQISTQNRAMYNLPGFPDITDKDILRYTRSNEKLNTMLPELIQTGLEADDLSVCKAVATMIPYAQEDAQPTLKKKISEFIQKDFKESGYVRTAAAEMIQYAPEDTRAGFIQRGLEDSSWYVRKAAARMIQYAPEDAQQTLKKKLSELIQKGFEAYDVLVRKLAVTMIQYAPQDARAELIQKGLGDSYWNVRTASAKMIQYTPEKAKAGLIQTGLKDTDQSVRTASATMIQYAPEDAQQTLKKKLSELIQRDFEESDWYIRAEAVMRIQYAPEDTRAGFIQQGLKDANESVRNAATMMIQYAPKDARSKLRELWQKTNPSKPDLDGLQTLATQTPLYGNDKQRFFKKEFDKSGSGTTLLDIVPHEETKTFKERVLIRHITAPSYFSWKKAFESSDYWKEQGFEYVPVEPIISVKPKGFTSVDVFTRVIKGPSVAEWKKNRGSFIEEIDHRVNQIQDGLNDLGIAHGHAHEGNFVLYFQRKEDGTADLSHPPRVYVIDFDQAVSPA